MRRKAAALLCALALSLSLCVPSAMAAQSAQGEVLPVLAAMGVMNGDEKGNLNLSANVTRAAFIKMAVAASSYKDMATTGRRATLKPAWTPDGSTAIWTARSARTIA